MKEPKKKKSSEIKMKPPNNGNAALHLKDTNGRQAPKSISSEVKMKPTQQWQCGITTGGNS